MKRLISLMLTFALCLSMAACGTADTPPAADSQTPSVSEPTAPDSTTSDVSESTASDSTTSDVSESAASNSTTPDGSESEQPEGPEQTSSAEPPAAEEPAPGGEPESEPATGPSEESSAEPEPPENIHPVHQHSYKDTVVKPTCTEKGYTTHTCSCGESYKDNEVAALGHKYTNEVIAPTTSAEGYTLYTCQTCGHSYKDNFVDKIADSTSGNVADSDLNGDKVGVTYSNAEDPNNVGIDNLGNLKYNINSKGEGTVIMHSDLQMVSNDMTENIVHFYETMNQIDGNVDVRGTSINYMGSECGSYKVNGNNYELYFNFMSTKVGRNVFLNALNYFGGDMGVSVWKMLREHYFFRSNDMIPISDELAAKYGLTITMLEDNGSNFVAKVSNGMDTWEIQYGCSGRDNLKTFIWIPA